MNCEINTDFVIIGGGPAGIAAAVAASRHGVDCLIVERANRIGGQLKAMHPDRNGSSRLLPEIKLLDQFSGHLTDAGVETIFNASVYRLEPNRELHFTDGDTNYTVKFQCLLIATGAREHVVPFTGWTLPGVMTTGAAQRAAVQARISPGDNIMVAGSGPLLLLGAAQLIKSGVNVVAIIEATPRWHMLKNGCIVFARDRIRGRQAFDYLLSIYQARVPLITGHVVIEAQGDGQVERVITARLDHEAMLDNSKKRSWDVDALCITHGLKPNNRICRAIGCDMSYDPRSEAYFPDHNQMMRTNIPWVYVAGEVAGIGGAGKAMLEGEITGLQVARELEYISADLIAKRTDDLSVEHQKALNSWCAVSDSFLDPSSLTAMTQPETLVCRCEEVNLESMHLAIQEGDGSLKDLKLRTRMGMGMCQGRQCENMAINELSAITGTPPDEIDQLGVRPPIEPIRLKNLSDWAV